MLKNEKLKQKILLSENFQKVIIDPRDCAIVEKLCDHGWSFQYCYKVKHKPSNKIYTMKCNNLDHDIEAWYISNFNKRLHFLKENQFSFRYLQPVVNLTLLATLESNKNKKRYSYAIYSFKEYIDGACLQSIYRVTKDKINPLNLHVLAKITANLLIILDKLHRMKHYHGNLVPSNIIIKPNGELMLVDSFVPSFDYGANPDYDPPRMGCWHPLFKTLRFDGTDRPNAKWDIYQLGLTLINCFLGGICTHNLSIHRMRPDEYIANLKKHYNHSSVEESFFDFVSPMISLDVDTIPSIRYLLRHPFIQNFINKALNPESLRLHEQVPKAESLNKLIFPSLEDLCIEGIVKHNIPVVDESLPRELILKLAKEKIFVSVAKPENLSPCNKSALAAGNKFSKKSASFADAKLVKRAFSSSENSKLLSNKKNIRGQKHESQTISGESKRI